jgi:excisionase family DNA binding protein
MDTRKPAKSGAKSTANSHAKTAVSVARAATTGKTKARQAPTTRNRTVTTAQPAGHVSVQRLRLPDALLLPVKLPQLDAIKELEKVVSRATKLTVGEGATKIQIGGDTLLAIKQVIRALSSTRVSILVREQTDIELTSQEVADMLNVSRPYVVKLAREGELPHKMVGNRHRFLLSAVQEYESLRRVERDEALTAIVPKAGYAAKDF